MSGKISANMVGAIFFHSEITNPQKLALNEDIKKILIIFKKNQNIFKPSNYLILLINPASKSAQY